MKLLARLPLLLLLAGWSGLAEEFPAVQTAARRDLDAALKELAEARAQVEAEKLPLAQQLGELEDRLLKRRTEVQAAERAQENDIVALNDLKRQARDRTEQVRYVDTLLATYLNSFRSRIHPVERPRHEALFADFDRAAAAPDLPADERLTAKAALVAASLDRVAATAGGEVLVARVLDAAGRLEDGQAVLFGPIAYFVGRDPANVGLVQEQLNRADPALFPLPAAASGLRDLAAKGEGIIPLDVTLGNAAKIAGIRLNFGQRLLSDFQVGGIVMWPLAFLAFASVGIAAYKWWELSRVRIATPMDVQKVLRALEEGREQQAVEHARAVPGPAGEMLVAAMEHLDEKKEYIEEVMYERMLATKPRLEALLPFIALAATAAPLLGLLGTVTGMISTFSLISLFGTGDPRTLSSGISEALVTTKWGLIIAIPSVVLYAFLSRKARGLLAGMEQTAVSFINGLPDRRETVPA